MANASAIAQSGVAARRRPILAVHPFAESDAAPGLGFGVADALARLASRRDRYVVLCRLAATVPRGRALLGNHAEGRLIWSIEGRVSQPGGRLHVHATLTTPTADDIALDEVGAARDYGQLIERLAARIAEAVGDVGTLAALSPAPRWPAWPAFRHAAAASAPLWSMRREESPLAGDELRRAVAEDPGFAAAHGLLGFIAARDFRRGWTPDKSSADAAARAHSDAALAADPEDPVALWTAAFAHGMLFRTYDDASDLIDRCLAVDPCETAALAWGALFKCYAWDFDAAVALASRARRLAPTGPLAETTLFAGALGAIHAHRYADAVDWADRANALNPQLVNTLRIRAAGLARLGRLDEARATVTRILEIDPEETIARSNALNPLREWRGFAHYIEALRLAGLPE